MKRAGCAGGSCPRTSGRTSRARLRAARRCGAAFTLLSPTLWITGGDLLRRPARIAAFDRLHALGYLASVAGVAIFWAALVLAASSRRPRTRRIGAAMFLAIFVPAAAVQAAMFALYHAYFCLDAGVYVDSLPWILLGTLPLRPMVVAQLAAALAAGVAILALARKLVRPRRPRALLLLPVAGLCLAWRLPVSYLGVQSSSPDLIYLHGVSRIVGDKLARAWRHQAQQVRLQRRSPERVPDLLAAPARPRNVLFILQESLRADATCSAYDPACAESNLETNELLPGRLPLLRMRSNTSSTFIAVSSIFAGLDPTESEARLHGAPLLWEYAHAAGYDAAFWTNQHPMFATYRLFFQDLPLSHACWSTDIDPAADVLAGPSDARLSERVVHDWGELREPFFAVVQYSNIHFPRIFDAERAPFQPSDPFERDEPWRNHYKNVAYLSDLAVARLVEHVRGSAAGARTVIVFSSDHGEALGEHDNENFHASSVHDEELRVPAWIDAPPGALSPEERGAILGKRDAPVFQLDLGPTFLDLLGVWDAPALAPFRARMPGRPLTRPELAPGPSTLTNVSWVWEYWKPNWGLMRYPMKILAGPSDHAYACFDLATDPFEDRDLGEAACAPLVARAREIYHVLPEDLQGHLRSEPRWGRR